MGTQKYSSKQRERAGKVDSPLNRKLKKVKWGEFNLEELFGKASRGLRLKSSDRILGNLPFVTAGETDQGVSAFIGNDVQVFKKNTVTIDMFGSAKYRNYNYGGDDHIAIVHTEDLPEGAVKFITSAIHKASNTGEFHYGRNFYPKDADSLNIMLPIKGNLPDYDFMNNLMLEIEAYRIAKLEAYLLKTGLNEHSLTKEEQGLLDKYERLEWGKFTMEVLFERIKTKKLPYKAEDLLKIRTKKYNLPCLTSSFKNQGLNYYAPKDEATVLKNVVSIPSNSDVYRAYYQANEFTVLSDAYAIRWIFDDIDLQANQYLFSVQCINKVTDLSIYSYKNKLGGWNIVKNKQIQLPIKNGKPDYETMHVLISGLKKIVIKDVVAYIKKVKSELAA